MNIDKLKELAAQAGFKVFGDKIIAADDGSSGRAAVSLNKFADLLVADCAARINACVSAYEGSERDQDYAAGLQNAAEIIKEVK